MARNNMGKLYGLGMGPGDPDLVTVRAAKVLGRVDTVFAAGSTKNDYSLALTIAREHLNPDASVVKLGFPMTKDKETLSRAWEDNAAQVLEVLRDGKDAAFITIGDPQTYSTFGYLAQTLARLEPEAEVISVPGITSYLAAASRMNLPLVEGAESLMVVSGISEPEKLEALSDLAENLVILKTYRNYDDISKAVEKLEPARRAYVVSNCCLPEERVEKEPHALRGTKMPYLTLMIVKSSGCTESGEA